MQTIFTIICEKQKIILLLFYIAKKKFVMKNYLKFSIMMFKWFNYSDDNYNIGSINYHTLTINNFHIKMMRLSTYK